jgi:hypothetical protein
MNDIVFDRAGNALGDIPVHPVALMPTSSNCYSPQADISPALLPPGSSNASVFGAGSFFLDVIRPALFLAVSGVGAFLSPLCVSGVDSQEDLTSGRWLTLFGTFNNGYRMAASGGPVRRGFARQCEMDKPLRHLRRIVVATPLRVLHQNG